MGRLTTHVLDTVNGAPAAGMALELWRLSSDGGRERLLATTTNADGRVDAPLLDDAAMIAGEYEMIFDVRAYFVAKNGEVGASPFLDRVPVRFTIFDAGAHYHVPLLVSPWAYSTYRGS